MPLMNKCVQLYSNLRADTPDLSMITFLSSSMSPFELHNEQSHHLPLDKFQHKHHSNLAYQIQAPWVLLRSHCCYFILAHFFLVHYLESMLSLFSSPWKPSCKVDKTCHSIVHEPKFWIIFFFVWSIIPTVSPAEQNLWFGVPVNLVWSLCLLSLPVSLSILTHLS